MSVLAAVGPSAYWYLARGTGAVSLILLTASLVLGILGPLRFAAPRWPRFAIDALHRDVSLLVIAVLVVHIITSVLDSFAPIKLIDAVIPFVSAYRPLWIGFGAIAFDLLVALVITSVLRRRIGYRGWRAIHWLAYASWPVAVLHGLGTGSDTKIWWMLILTVACVAAVAVACWIRFARDEQLTAGARNTALALTAITPLGLAIFTLAGPLQHGWAGRAGTPRSLLASSRVRTVAVVQHKVAPRSGGWSKPFSARLNGTVTQTNEPGGAVVDLSAQVTGGLSGRLRMRLAGTPLSDGGLSMTGSQIDLLGSGHSTVLDGHITALEGEQFIAAVSDGSGGHMQLHGTLHIDAANDTVTGALSGSPGSGE
jgi:DMSO/TMAO reductase YedYZ heme-binding membrane subunit